MQYKIEYATYLNELEIKVNALIRSGWKIQGGVAFAFVGRESLWVQSMTKNKPIKRKLKTKQK